MGVMTSANTAGADREVATQTLNRELQDKGFLLDHDRGHHQLGAERLACTG